MLLQSSFKEKNMILPAITTVGNTITVNSKERGRKSYQQDRSAAEPTEPTD